MEFSVSGLLKSLAFKASDVGPRVVIVQETDGTNTLAQLGMFVGQEIQASYEYADSYDLSGTLTKMGYRPQKEEEGPKVVIEMEGPAGAALGALGVAVGRVVEARYRPWQLALEDADASTGVRKGPGGQMPLATP